MPLRDEEQLKIIIAGGREVEDYAIVRQAVIASGYWKEFGRKIEVICGMARGVDLLGKEFAERNGLIVHEFPADWKNLGKAAGHIRNAEMGAFAKAHEGRLLAVWDGISPGTRGMIGWAEKNGLKRFVYKYREQAGA